MNIISATELRKNIYQIIKNILHTREPVFVSSKKNKEVAVIISQREWEDIQETLFLLSHKDARETIRNELQKPIDEGVEIRWQDGK